MNLTKLFDFSSDSDAASFQWNISVPITILILLFIGVYISEVKPRQGRFLCYIARNAFVCDVFKFINSRKRIYC